MSDDIQQHVSTEPEEKGWRVLSTYRLVKAEWNYKMEEEGKAEALANNIRRNGQVVNCVVRPLPDGEGGYQRSEDGEVLYELADGNHRKDAFEAAEVDAVVVYNLGDVTVEEAKRMAVEINETQFDHDPAALAEVLGDVQAAFDTEDVLATMPFGEEELAEFNEMLDFNFDNFEEDDEPPSSDDDEWERFEVALPEEVHVLWQDAKADIERRMEEDGYEVHEDEDVARGQILEALVAEYMGEAGPLEETES